MILMCDSLQLCNPQALCNNQAGESELKLSLLPLLYFHDSPVLDEIPSYYLGESKICELVRDPLCYSGIALPPRFSLVWCIIHGHQAPHS
jgi:hypothetical protein